MAALQQDSIQVLVDTPAEVDLSLEATDPGESSAADVGRETSPSQPSASVVHRERVSLQPESGEENTAMLDSAFYLYPFPEPEENVETVVALPPTPPAWLDGLLPVQRSLHSGNSQGFVSIIVVLLLGVCLSFRTIQRIWGTLLKHLWTTRVRDGYEHITTAERRTVGLLLCVAVFFLALVGTAGLAYGDPGSFSFNMATTLVLTCIVAGYFLFQYAAYWIIGYTFVNEDGRRLWVEGFTSAMALLGLGLLLPGLVVLFYPDVTGVSVGVSAVLYVAARIMFICKGFRIFYTNLGSIVYFILYLCALEIIPVAILYYSAYLCCANQ